MALQLIVETGKVVPNANSYVSVEEADEYNANMGNDAWPQPPEDPSEPDDQLVYKIRALVQARRTLDSLYSTQYMSVTAFPQQQLPWPRITFYDKNYLFRDMGVIPREIKEAQCEIALMIMNDDETQAPSANRDALIGAESMSVGDLSQSYTYKGLVNAIDVAQFPGFRKVELILYAIMSNRNAKSGFWMTR